MIILAVWFYKKGFENIESETKSSMISNMMLGFMGVTTLLILSFYLEYIFTK